MNKPMCSVCWDEINPTTKPTKIRPKDRKTEKCFICQRVTASGIYVVAEVSSNGLEVISLNQNMENAQ